MVCETGEVPEVALDRSVNRESKAFMGSILEEVGSAEGEAAGRAAEVEVAFRLGKRREAKTYLKHPHVSGRAPLCSQSGEKYNHEPLPFLSPYPIGLRG